MDVFDQVRNELLSMKKKEEEEFENNLVTNMISRLLNIEKQALYGNLKNKNKRQETIINEGFAKYKEDNNANS